jgi:hypothetical protein
MSSRFYIIIIVLASALRLFAAEDAVRIVRLRGDVRVRRGMEETWVPAGAGMLLKPLDTIFTGEASEAVLSMEDGSRFTLGGNAVLDAGDLRRITERQMFLFLMSQKVGRLTAPDSTAPLHIANVSVVRGSDKRVEAGSSTAADERGWVREKNGARALFDAGYVTNTVVKLHKIMQRYPLADDHGEIQFSLGQAFEALNETGRALDSYNASLEAINRNPDNGKTATDRRAKIEAAQGRLKANP